MKAKLAGAAIFVVMLAGMALGQTYTATDFSCTGSSEAGLCWLSDPRLYDTATWTFQGVPQDVPLRLRLEGTAEDYCHDCVGRDVLVRIYYGTGHGDWNRMELTLKSRGPGCTPEWYAVVGEAEFTWWSEVSSSQLVFKVQRVLECDPKVGFNLLSLTLEVPEVEVVPVPPPKPPPAPTPVPQPPPPPPPPQPEACIAGMFFTCAPPELAQECAPSGVDLATVQRQELPESFGPGESAIELQPGHYRGSLEKGDYQDWYRARVDFGEGAVVYVKTLGDLVLDVYVVHDPCGTDLAACLNVGGEGNDEAALVIPCYESLQCVKRGREDERVCFLSGACRVFIRLKRVSGAGDYFLSILPASLAGE